MCNKSCFEHSSELKYKIESNAPFANIRMAKIVEPHDIIESEKPKKVRNAKTCFHIRFFIKRVGGLPALCVHWEDE